MHKFVCIVTASAESFLSHVQPHVFKEGPKENATDGIVKRYERIERLVEQQNQKRLLIVREIANAEKEILDADEDEEIGQRLHEQRRHQNNLRIENAKNLAIAQLGDAVAKLELEHTELVKLEKEKEKIHRTIKEKKAKKQQKSEVEKNKFEKLSKADTNLNALDRSIKKLKASNPNLQTSIQERIQELIVIEERDQEKKRKEIEEKEKETQKRNALEQPAVPLPPRAQEQEQKRNALEQPAVPLPPRAQEQEQEHDDSIDDDVLNPFISAKDSIEEQH